MRKETVKTRKNIMGKVLSKELFETVIESIREQYNHDKQCSELISQIFPTESVGLYNNSKYLESLMALLRIFFPKDENGFCEIEHYCFQLDFGKYGEVFESPGELFERLVLIKDT